MTTATVRAVAAQFLEREIPEVLAIKGTWGVGKTYMWGKLLESLKSKVSRPSYSYVSLFGVASIAELRLAIFANSRSVDMLGEELTAANINENWLEYGKRGFKTVSQYLTRVKDLPYARNVTIGLETVAPHLISNLLVCLDDFERLSDKLPADQLLGFISSLKEQKNCKVVLIFNEERLGGNAAAIYTRYREKLVDIELLYEPAPPEAAAIAFDPEEEWSGELQDRAARLRITNIRLLRKVDRIVSLVWPHISALHASLKRQALDTIVLLAWCYYEPDEVKPSISFLRTLDTMQLAFAKQLKKEKKEMPSAEDRKEEAWLKLLDEYQFRRMDEFDLTLLKVVERGYIEESNLPAMAQQQDAAFRAADAEQSFSKAWRMFHDTFDNNEEQLIAALQQSFKTSVEHITPINVNGTVRLLRELGRDQIADELIDHYIVERGDEVGLFDLEEYAFAGDIDDARLRATFDAHHKVKKPAPSLAVAVKRMAKGSWGRGDERVLDGASENDLYALFKQDHGEELHRMVRACLRLGNEKDHKAVGERTRAALTRIGGESKVNAIRVARHLK